MATPEPATAAQTSEAAQAKDALPPLPKTAVLDDGIRAAQLLAQRQVLSAKEETLPDLQPLPDGPLPGLDLPVDPLPGFFTPMEMPPKGDPLAPFETALDELQAGTRTEPVRIAIYGASGTAIDLWTGYLRRYLQARFGDGGPGIVAAVPHNKWYRHHELSVKGSKHWTKHNAYRRSGETDPGYYGPIGVCHTTDHKRAWCEVGPSNRAPAERKLSYFEVLHLQQPGGGSYRVRLDGKQVVQVSTASQGTPSLGVHRIDLEPGQPTLRMEVVGDGPVRMLGVVAETGQPGVVVDTLAMDGARITNQLVWDEALWAESIKRRDPVIYALVFGTNSSVDEDDQPLSVWESGFRTVLERFDRALPEAGCLILGPGDYPIVQGDQILPRPRLAEIRSIERRLASEYGCAFYDGLKFAGGEGSKRAWVEAGLARDDYLHLTRAGYVRFGMGFADSLMQRYDWRRKHPPAG